MANRLTSGFLRVWPRHFRVSHSACRSQLFYVSKTSNYSFPFQFFKSLSTFRRLGNNQTFSAFRETYAETETKGQRFPEFQLDGRVFIVTGGGRGLGLTLAEVLVEAGGHGKQLNCT